jgi:glycolate oxidase FAD binding subunit
MNNDTDNSKAIQQQVHDAIASAAPLNICGGNSKNFYGNKATGAALDVSTHKGIVSYEPTELVVTARSGTTLKYIESELAAQNQMLAFEPPAYNEDATIGGTIACNLSGPRRPYAGAARDFMLGCKIINGKAEALKFGGQVMKNVAGYDVSRLMAGAMGTLGVLMEVSLKVLPRPETELTLIMPSGITQSIQKIQEWRRLPLPVSAIGFDSHALYVRISGAEKAINQAKLKTGGDVLPGADDFWKDINQHRLSFFSMQNSLWRISVPANTPPLSIQGEWLYEWGGAQRWLVTTVEANEIRMAVQAVGGHATLFRGTDDIERFQPLPGGLKKLHQQLKHAFDPHGILNPGRLYQDI